MATTRFFVRREQSGEQQGPCTLKDLRALFRAGKITAVDCVRDADRPDSSWTRIADWPKLAEVLEPRGPTQSTGQPVGAVTTADPGTVETGTLHCAAVDVQGGDRRWRKKDVWTMTVAATALLLTLVNFCWMLFTANKAEAQAEIPNLVTREERLQGKAPPLGQGAAVRDGEQNANPPGASSEQQARAASAVPEAKTAAGFEQVLRKLDDVTDRLDRLEQTTRRNTAINTFGDAMQSGVLEVRIGDVAFRFIYIPAGAFRFGYTAEDQNRVVSATGNPNAFLNATPDCLIQMSNGYFMLDREVTNRQWAACMKRKDSDDATDGSDSTSGARSLDAPKGNLSWVEATAFCDALQAAEPRLSNDVCEVRLPTEIEWEYAGRGAHGLDYPWPPEPASPQPFYGVAKGTANAPLPVDGNRNRDQTWRRQFDFAGNLSEWCLDRYDQSLHETLVKRQGSAPTVQYDPVHDPIVQQARKSQKDGGNPSRTFRGGSFIDPPAGCELPMRRFLLENKSADHIGLRPVIVLTPSESIIPEDAK